ncbi:NAD(P)H-dependent oxidoreductase [Desulfosarcina sp. OttesenSCG-928-A07]|nr:NAD(P)H-dependent oxidoreductase [Desulfosarcina sp. OttesenSCG-928-A07]
MKVSIVYHSESGNTQKMAACIVEGLQSVDGIDAKAFGIDAVDKEFVKQSRVVIVGTPVYGGSLTAKLKTWMETEARELKLGGKVGGAFATAAYVHGGGDVAIQSILSQMLVFGMLVYSGGAAMGKPVIHYGPVAIGGDTATYGDLFKLYGKRMAEKAKELFAE